MKIFVVEYIAKDPVNSKPINNYRGRVCVYAPSSEIAIKMVVDKYRLVYKIVNVYSQE